MRRQQRIGQSWRADSLVRSNGPNPRGGHATRAQADAVVVVLALVVSRALLRVETRAPLFGPLAERGQSCPQQQTKRDEASGRTALGRK